VKRNKVRVGFLQSRERKAVTSERKKDAVSRRKKLLTNVVKL